MNQTQVNNFLACLLQIDDLNYLDLHARAAAINGINSHNRTTISPVAADDSHEHDHDHDHEHEHEHDHDHEHSSSHDLLVAKIVAMVVLFCASALCGSIPFLLNRCFKWTETNTNARSATVVKCLLYFGGGVLLCTTFLHLLPEVQETVELLQTCGSIPELTFALAEMLMCAGFFLMYLIEEVIHAWVHRNKKLLQQDEGAGAAFERGHSVRNSYLVKGKAAASSSASTMQLAIATPEKLESVATAPPLTSNSTANGNANFALSVQDLISNDLENQKYEQAQKSHDGYQQHDHHHHHHHQHHEHHHGHSHHGHGHSHLPVGDSDDDLVTSSLRGLFIVLALSLHELFEGMAIGLEGSAQSVWFMFGAVSAHKLVLAFCVGVELIVARTRTTLCIVYVLTFAIVSPIGIGVGILISHNQDASQPSITSAVLQGLACGTLLYVVFFEILSKNRAGLVAYLALVVGFAVLFGLQQLGVDADGHGHSHGSCGRHTESSDSSSSPTRSLPTDNHHHHHHNHQHDHHESSSQSPYAQDDNFEQQLQFLRQASQNLMQSNKKLN